MGKKTIRTFKHFPKDSMCPICKTNKDKECFLIAIVGTENGNIVEAQPFHTGCLDLAYDKTENIIYQSFKK